MRFERVKLQKLRKGKPDWRQRNTTQERNTVREATAKEAELRAPRRRRPGSAPTQPPGPPRPSEGRSRDALPAGAWFPVSGKGLRSSRKRNDVWRKAALCDRKVERGLCVSVQHRQAVLQQLEVALNRRGDGVRTCRHRRRGENAQRQKSQSCTSAKINLIYTNEGLRT